MPTPFADALAPMAARMPRGAREIEILRVSAQLEREDTGAAAEAARKAVLSWAQNKAPGSLPKEAWRFSEFEHLSGGRNCAVVRIEREDADVWALRQDDPDKNVAGRNWSAEFVIGGAPGERAHLSVRLLVNTSEAEFSVEPHVPGPVLQMIDGAGLVRGGRPLTSTPRPITSEWSAEDLCDHLEDPERRLPIIVASTEDDEGEALMIDAATVARATAGFTRVVVLPAEWTWVLTRRLGRVRSVFGGAVRLYMPGFSRSDDPYRHRLFLADHLVAAEEARACEAWLRRSAAAASISTSRLGRDVLEFAQVKTGARLLDAERVREGGASDSDRLRAAEAYAASLEEQLRAKEREIDGWVDEAEAAEERAKASERDHRALLYRFRDLQARQAGTETRPEPLEELPTAWADLLDWVEASFADRLHFTPGARKMSRNPEYEDVEAVARALRWLATEAYQRRVEGGGSLRDATVEPGVRNSLCGGDEYRTAWRGRTHMVDWHIKNGGNTRDPKRCLRIYYFWEPDEACFVIDHLPAHRVTAAT
ncbi:MAG: hypothetical protein AAGG50_08685 [Bacteroidota bacterium]